ncbi:MAG: GNAT family N-acetyltransferase [Nevskiales bacterium]
MIVEPIILAGKHVRLEPLSADHVPGLLRVSTHAEIWRWMPFTLQSEEQWQGFLKVALKMVEAKTALPFVIFAKATDSLVGATGYWYIDRHHRRLEIGASWVTLEWQRSGINTEAKHLLLRHAFEQLGCIRVEFKTDSLNKKSRTALKRIGATEEGLLRNHMLQPDGRKRHSVCFSIIDEEWPTVKARLEGLMATHESAGLPPVVGI